MYWHIYVCSDAYWYVVIVLYILLRFGHRHILRKYKYIYVQALLNTGIPIQSQHCAAFRREQLHLVHRLEKVYT
jgi:hypothetical protein